MLIQQILETEPVVPLYSYLSNQTSKYLTVCQLCATVTLYNLVTEFDHYTDAHDCLIKLHQTSVSLYVKLCNI